MAYAVLFPFCLFNKNLLLIFAVAWDHDTHRNYHQWLKKSPEHLYININLLGVLNVHMADTDLILMCLHKSVLKKKEKKRKEESNIYTFSMLNHAEGFRVGGIFSLVNTQNPTGSQTQCLQ